MWPSFLWTYSWLNLIGLSLVTRVCTCDAIYNQRFANFLVNNSFSNNSQSLLLTNASIQLEWIDLKWVVAHAVHVFIAILVLRRRSVICSSCSGPIATSSFDEVSLKYFVISSQQAPFQMESTAQTSTLLSLILTRYTVILKSNVGLIWCNQIEIEN